jgi:putative FmdB family regulatory protein
MPFYEYQCKFCGSHHEVLQKISEAPLKKCPKCQKAGLSKLVSAPVFRLKGGGWYETDFKSDQETKRNLVGSDSDSGATESSSDTAAKSTKTTTTETPKATPSSDKPAKKAAAQKARTSATKAVKKTTKRSPKAQSKRR